jgi:DNA-binding NarL/FixJ family response regulator
MTTQQPITIIIVDDHPGVRNSVAVMLDLWDDFHLVGEAENGIEAVELCRRLRPDIVLMDLMMPVMDGIEAIEIIHQYYPSSRVIAITTFEGEERVQAALEAGAVAYLLKNCSVNKLAATIRAVHKNIDAASTG